MMQADTAAVVEGEAASLPVHGVYGANSDDEGGGGSWVKKLVVVVFIVVTIGLVAWKIQANMADQQPVGRKAGSGDRAVPVVAAAVQQKMMPIYLTGLGTVTPYYAVTIRARVDGQLMAVKVREGQTVKEGELLAVIDPAPYQAAVAQAEGQLARDQATANYARTEADRFAALFKAGVVSEDSAQTQVANAGQSAGAILADKAAIQAAKVSLAYTQIKSPIDGVVGLRQVDPGNIVHAADATGLLLVTQVHPITVVFTLPEDELPQVQQMILKGEQLSVEAYDRSETKRLAVGKLLTLDNQIDTTTGSDKVKAVFDNKANELFPNQFVNIRLVLRQQEDALVIPSAAVQTGSQGTFVYVVKQGDPPNKGDDGSNKASEEKPKMKAKPEAPAAVAGGGEEKAQKFYVESRPIVIAVVEGTQVIVDSGLKPGERVVIDGQEKLKSGTKVSPKLDGGKGNGGAKGGKSGASEGREKGADAATAGADSKGLEAMGGGKAHKVGPKP